MGIHLMPPLFELVTKPRPTQPPITITAYQSKAVRYIGVNNESYASCWGAAVGTDVYATPEVGSYELSGPRWVFERTVLYFDTSSISPGNIALARILSDCFKWSTVNFDVVLQNGQPTYPSDPPVVDDYNKAFYSGDGGRFNTSLVVLGGAGQVNIPLILNLSGRSWINYGGITKLVVRSQGDIQGASDGQNNTFTLRKSGAPHPRLEITFYA